MSPSCPLWFKVLGWLRANGQEAIDFFANLTNNVRVQMHTNRFSYVFSYRYFFGSSGVADGV